MRTELSKIVDDGWGDYFFYGFGIDGEGLATWRLGDLRVFRSKILEWDFLTDGGRDAWLSERLKRNDDKSSHFAFFEWDLFPGMVVADGSNP